MATKSKRTTKTRESILRVESSTDEVNGSSSSIRPQSPSNMYAASRQDEKNQLSHLNDRLATYIDKVRNLETENSRLHIQINEIETVEKKQRDNLSDRYEGKIAELRKLIEVLTRDKARLQIDIDKAFNERDDKKSRATKLEKDFKKCESERKQLLSQNQDITAMYHKSDNARSVAEKENEELKREADTLKKQLDLLQQQLEDETVIRTEIENRLKTLKEDLDFARREHMGQMDEVRKKRQVDMATFSSEIEGRYQAKLQEQLQTMRADFENRIAQNRAEVDDLYKNKLDEAVQDSNRNRDSAVKAREEHSFYRNRVHELENSAKESAELIERLNRRLSDLDARTRQLREESEIRLKQRDDQIAQLQKEIGQMITDYQDLLDIKVQLDTELQAYHKLLEGEETRLHITPTASPNVSLNISGSPGHHVSFAETTSILGPQSGSRRGVKRKRLNDDFLTFDQMSQSYKTNHSSDGDLMIDEADREGKFVRLENHGNDDISIGSWILKYIAGDKEVTFKFSSRQVVKAGKSLTIWSNNAGQEHGVPMNIVMKNQAWPTGDASRIELQNSDSHVVAWYEGFLEQTGYYHEAGTDPNQRCSIM